MLITVLVFLLESKPAESPTTFEEREKRLQKEYSCVENLNQERIPPSDTSFLVMRRRSTPAEEASSASVARMSPLFQRPFCSYWSKKKANPTLHINVHRDSPDELVDSPLRTPRLDRYCAKCDIQFASYKSR
ncbi:c2H2-type domain-containing protein [Caerostris extrusa]|uniref:C2H2-type domain-containing protein n=1 Tax=Caerostris extrusa TaxID=172846 RepID=A0AAV4S9I3_CAEEX|nr:c2H2-type domain-containing protein [Caerostris extrusa]